MYSNQKQKTAAENKNRKRRATFSRQALRDADPCVRLCCKEGEKGFT